MSGENEYGLKEVIEDLRDSVKQLTDAVNSMKIMMLTDYVKKTECENCRADLKKYTENNDASHNMIIGWTIGAYVLGATVMGIITSYWSQKQ